jgi:hypothetical protein
MPRAMIPTPARICEFCGAAFERKPRHEVAHFLRQRYCSHPCSQLARRLLAEPKPCAACGKPLAQKPGEWTTHFNRRRFCNLRCANANKPIGPKTRYRMTTAGGRKIATHRAVMERMIKHPLGREDHVHHINEDKLDNAPGNLLVLDATEHGRLHHAVYPRTKTCEVCGVEFTPHKTKRKRQRTCGGYCARVLANRTRKASSPSDSASSSAADRWETA